MNSPIMIVGLVAGIIIVLLALVVAGQMARDYFAGVPEQDRIQPDYPKAATCPQCGAHALMFTRTIRGLVCTDCASASARGSEKDR